MGKNRRMAKTIRFMVVAALAALVLTSCAAGQRANTPNETLYNYAGALRWGGFEQALEFVDPQLREQAPPSALDLERYRQVEVKGYQVTRTAALGGDGLQRDVEISLVNRHTQRERVVRHREVWRFAPVAKRWWLSNGLPDITAD
jgi:hypothetical protein